jgi:hypothetical protein
VETGIIRQLPTGEFIEETRPLDEEQYAKIARPEPLPLPAGEGEAHAEVPAPGMRGGLGRVKTRLNKIVTENVPVNGHGGDGHGPNGHGPGAHADDEHAAVTAGSHESDADGSPEHH